MPRIPRAPERGPSNIGGIRIPDTTVDTSLGYKNKAAVAEGFMEFARKIGDQKLQAATRNYASNAFSADLISTKRELDELRLKTPVDGRGYFDNVNNHLTQIMEQRKSSAPSDEAYALWQQKFSSFRDRQLIAADQYENKLLTKSLITGREEVINETAVEMTIAPDFKTAAEFISTQNKDILGETNNLYSPLQAGKLQKTLHNQIANALMDGYSAQGTPEMNLAILGSVLPPERYWKILEKAGYSADRSLPVVNSKDAATLLQHMTSGEVARRLRSTLNELQSKNKALTESDISQLRDLETLMSATGTTPDTTAIKQGVKKKIIANTNLKPIKKAEYLDDLYMSEAVGNAIKEAINLPLDATKKSEDAFLQQVQKAKTELFEDIQNLEDHGYANLDVLEAVKRITSKEFNATKVAQIKKSYLNRLSQARAEMLKDPPTYFAQSDSTIDDLQDVLLSSEYTSGTARAPAFETYARYLNSKYRALKFNNSEMKYLNPEMSRYYARSILNQPNAAKSIDQIYNLAQEFGPLANKVFHEMGQRGDLPNSVFAISQVDPRMRTHVEDLFNILRDKEGLERIEKKFDERFGSQIDLKETITDELAYLKYVVKRTDPSGRSLYTVDGLEQLMRLGSISDVVAGDSKDVNKAVGKWKKILVEPYKIIERNNSIMFTKWDTAKYHNDAEEFLTRAHGFHNLHRSSFSLVKQLQKMGLNSGIAPNKEWVFQARELGDPKLAEEKLDERLNSAEWVMNPTFDGLILMHTDTGTRRPMKDINGRKFEIPLSKLNQFSFPERGRLRRFTSQ